MVCSRKILHVDDDPDILRIVGKKLESAGFSPRGLTDPREIEGNLGDVSIALLDMQLPGTNGIKLLRQIKEYDAQIGVIIVTGLDEDSTVFEAMKYGAEACIFKPIVDYDELIDVVEVTFAKTERWWDCFDQIRQRKKQQQLT